nr:unnamed protein product [Callosobruchus chinensis]
MVPHKGALISHHHTNNNHMGLLQGNTLQDSMHQGLILRDHTIRGLIHKGLTRRDPIHLQGLSSLIIHHHNKMIAIVANGAVVSLAYHFFVAVSWTGIELMLSV